MVSLTITYYYVCHVLKHKNKAKFTEYRLAVVWTLPLMLYQQTWLTFMYVKQDYFKIILRGNRSLRIRFNALFSFNYKTIPVLFIVTCQRSVLYAFWPRYYRNTICDIFLSLSKTFIVSFLRSNGILIIYIVSDIILCFITPKCFPEILGQNIFNVFAVKDLNATIYKYRKVLIYPTQLTSARSCQGL